MSDCVIVMKNGKVELIFILKVLFGCGNCLISLGLDVFFISRLMVVLVVNGFDIGIEYFIEKELEE